VNNLAKVSGPRLEVEPATSQSQLRCSTNSATSTPTLPYQRRRKQIESGGHEFRRFAPEKIFFCALHFSVVPPQFKGALHTPGWAQRWAVIAHCLFVKKWPVAKTETKIQ